MPLLHVCLDCGRAFEGRGSRCPEHERSRHAKQARSGFALYPWSRYYQLPEWRRTSEQCRSRDGYACARCGATQRLSVHHIVSLKDLYERTRDWTSFVAAASDLTNLVTLCPRHHREAEQARSQGGGSR